MSISKIKSALQTVAVKTAHAGAVFVLTPVMAAQAQGYDLQSSAFYFSRYQLNSIPNLIAAISFIAGIVIIVVGVLKLKEHFDSPQNKLSPAIARLVIGGVLVALPSFVGWVHKSTEIGGYNTPFQNEFIGNNMSLR